jgi:hypothetical protein
MDHLVASAKSGKIVLLALFGTGLLFQKTIGTSQVVTDEVFGHDGNGGHMLKILTDLTDEEMARLKF